MQKAIYISYDGVLEALGQSQVLPYLKDLSGRGIEFHLVTFEKKLYREAVEKVGLLKSELDKYNIKWYNIAYHKYPPVLSTAFDILSGCAVCVFIYLKERPVIVHGRSYVASLICWVLKKIFRIKFIFDMRGFWADERVEGRIWKAKGCLYRFAKYIEKLLLKDADEVIVLTNKARAILKDWGYKTENVSVIPCCVDTGRFVFNDNARTELRRQYNLLDKFVFLHTGSLEFWYMKDKMLDYFRLSMEILRNSHFMILSNDDPEKIMKLISERKLDLKCFTILSVPFNKMPDYISMADAGIFFITPVFSKQASVPTKFAEYISCGIPVISNDKIGDLEEYIVKNDAGVIIRKFCEEEYRLSIARLLNLMKDQNLRNRCRAAACNDFNVKSGGDKYYQVYARLN